LMGNKLLVNLARYQHPIKPIARLKF